jgi:xanthine dehydrogenase iron-sulfur cluster and FAD-binding subunit A
VQGIRCVFFDVGYTLSMKTSSWQQRCREQAETEEAKRLGLTPCRIYAAIEEAARRTSRSTGLLPRVMA